MPVRIITPELTALIVREYHDRGQSMEGIAHDQQIGLNTVRRCLAMAGVPKRPRVYWSPVRHTLSQATRDQAIALYQAGESCLKIALHLGVCSDTVVRWLKLANIPLRPQVRRTRPTPREYRHTRPIIIVGGRAPWGGWWCPDCPTRCESRAELADHKGTHGGDV